MSAHVRPLRGFVVPPKLPEPISPALLDHLHERAADLQNRIADAITRFSGAMPFVYLHVIWFSCWIGFGVGDYPFGLLTMIVSLEAIFLSTFVMISRTAPTRSAGSSSTTSGRRCRRRTARTRSCSTSHTRSSSSPARCTATRRRRDTLPRSRLDTVPTPRQGAEPRRDSPQRSRPVSPGRRTPHLALTQSEACATGSNPGSKVSATHQH
jgi:hypothetical protein